MGRWETNAGGYSKVSAMAGSGQCNQLVDYPFSNDCQRGFEPAQLDCGARFYHTAYNKACNWKFDYNDNGMY